MRSTIRRQAGYSLIELIVGIGVLATAMATTTGLFVASRNFMMDQELQLETTQAARATLDMMVRDLRLGGACLPVNGDFVSVDGTNSSTHDEITTRTGLIRPDLSCVGTAVTSPAGGVQGDQTLTVGRADGFEVGMRGYIRNTAGTGEFFKVTSVDKTNNTLGITPGLSTDYPFTSGVYAIDERRYLISNWDGTNNALYVEMDNDPGTIMPFAIGVEGLDITYQLNRNCPPCDVVQIPADDSEWATVQQIFLTVTARSLRTNRAGQYYHRTMTVGVKPRNLLPQ